MQPDANEFSPHEGLEQVAQRLDSLIQAFEQHPIEQVRDQALEMLGLIDALHRGGIQRLVEILWNGNPALLEKALNDPAINVLLQLYDLAPVELAPREQVEEALQSVLPYIESHGGAVEVLDVIGGVVHLRLSGSCQGCAGSAMTLKRGIEAALREGFPGFEGIEVHEPAEVARPAGLRFNPSSPMPANFIPLQQVTPGRTVNRPVFTPVGTVAALPVGAMKSVEVEGKSILLCNVEGEIYAYHNACAGSSLPLHHPDGVPGELKDVALLCPWHNCVYDARTGKRLDGGSGRLDVIPVAVRDGEIQLALNVEPVALG